MITFTERSHDVMPAVRRRRRLEAVVGVTLVTVLFASARPGGAQTTAQPRSIFQGSVPVGESSGTVLPLSLEDTFDRALKYNLGILEGAQDVRAARALRLRS